MLKPQDVLVLLKIAVSTPGVSLSFDRLARSIGMSAAEAYDAAKRAESSRLLQLEGTLGNKRRGQRKTVNRAALVEFLVHGLKYVFPAQRSGVTRGLPTSVGAPYFQKLSRIRLAIDDMISVWPYHEGQTRGLSLEPLFPSAPFAARQDESLYELLILVDVLRDGRARERAIAENELRKRILDEPHTQ